MRNVLLGIFVVVCAGALTWPGYAWLGNRIEPYVLGMPFSLVWVAGWVALSFVALAAYHLCGPADDDDASPDESAG